MPELDEFDACFHYERFTSELESKVRKAEKKIACIQVQNDVLAEKVASMIEEREELLQEIAKLKETLESRQTQDQDPE